MGFRLIKTGRTYADKKDHAMHVVHDLVDSSLQCPTPDDLSETKPDTQVLSPIIWKGTIDECRSLLVVREAELVLAKAQLTGNDRYDWYLNNRIANLEIQIRDLYKWLTEMPNE